MSEDAPAPGMDAIHAAMVALHGLQEPAHWLLDSSLGVLGPRLEAASAYDAGDHWHLVTLGVSNIWETSTGDDSAVSGLGHEFTMRVVKPRRPRWSLSRAGNEPPAWAVRFLQRLGDVTLTGTRFRAGETLDPGGPITGESSGGLVAVGFVTDPALGRIDTPNGTVEFIQVVALTAEQLDLVRRGESGLRSFAGRDGLFIADPDAHR